MGFRNGLAKVFLTDEYLQAAQEGNKVLMGNLIEGNNAVNSLGKFVADSTFFGWADVARKYSIGGMNFKDAMKTTFYTDPNKKFGFNNLQYGKIAGSTATGVFGANVVGGAVSGGFTDDNGNFDVQGIPLI